MLTRLAALLAALLITGCTQFYAQQSNVDAQIDVWIEQHRYDKALATIEALNPAHEKYDELTQRAGVIESKREDYIEEVLHEASLCEPEKDWAKAVAIINNGLKNLPNAPELREQRAQYEERRLNSISRSERTILIARGRYLLATRDSEENLVKANPTDYFAQQRYRTFQKDLQQASRELYAIGKQALYENRSPDAVEALTLSNRLAPNDLSQELLSSIQQAQRAERTTARNTARNEETAVAEQQWPILESSYREALKRNDLIGARRLVAEMKEINPSSSLAFEEQLDGRIIEETASLRERGKLLYGQGFLREALDVWQRALELNPNDPELIANTQRVETFLKNLDRWGN